MTAVDDSALEMNESILDRVIPSALIDNRSGINNMPFTTMVKLRLSITGPSPYIIKVADERPITFLDKITQCQIEGGGEVYKLTSHILQLESKKAAYPILLEEIG